MDIYNKIEYAIKNKFGSWNKAAKFYDFAGENSGGSLKAKILRKINSLNSHLNPIGYQLSIRRFDKKRNGKENETKKLETPGEIQAE